MKALKIVLIFVALAIFGCAGVERKSDKCVVAALENQLKKQERLNERREYGKSYCEPYEMPGQEQEKNVEFKRCVVEKVGLEDFAYLTQMYISSMRWKVRSCLRR